MDFVASLASSLAWPVTIASLTVAGWKSGALTRLVDRLTRARVPGGLEFDFDRAPELEVEIEPIPDDEEPAAGVDVPPVTPPRPVATDADHWAHLALFNPQLLVSTAAVDLIVTLVKAEELLGVDSGWTIRRIINSTTWQAQWMAGPAADLLAVDDAAAVQYVLEAGEAARRDVQLITDEQAMEIARLSDALQAKIWSAAVQKASATG